MMETTAATAIPVLLCFAAVGAPLAPGDEAEAEAASAGVGKVVPSLNAFSRAAFSARARLSASI